MNTSFLLDTNTKRNRTIFFCYSKKQVKGDYIEIPTMNYAVRTILEGFKTTAI